MSLFPDVKRRAIRELGYGTNAKLMVGFSERVWRTRHRSNGSVLTSLPFQLTWETSRQQKGKSGILTNFTGGAQALRIGQGTAASQAQRMVEELDQIFPGAQAAHMGMPVARFHWHRFHGRAEAIPAISRANGHRSAAPSGSRSASSTLQASTAHSLLRGSWKVVVRPVSAQPRKFSWRLERRLLQDGESSIQ